MEGIQSRSWDHSAVALAPNESRPGTVALSVVSTQVKYALSTPSVANVPALERDCKNEYEIVFIYIYILFVICSAPIYLKNLPHMRQRKPTTGNLDSESNTAQMAKQMSELFSFSTSHQSFCDLQHSFITLFAWKAHATPFSPSMAKRSS